MASAYDKRASMDQRHDFVPARPPAWQPLVSPSEWAILAQALVDTPEVLDDLRVILAELSPGVRSSLVANVMKALASGTGPRRAIWKALAITGHEVRLCSAVALGELHKLREDAPGGVVRELRPKE